MANNGTGRRAMGRPHGAEGAGDEPGAANLPSFEEAFGQLEEIVQALGNGHLLLDEALALFERGVHLEQICREMLDRAQLRVRQLTPVEGEDGARAIEELELDIE